MKQKLLSFLLGVGVVFSIANAAIAANYTYRVYNPTLNKSDMAVLGTVSLTDTKYVWGFYTREGRPLCVANLNTNTDKNGLVGGQCTDIHAFMSYLSGKNVDVFSPKYTFGYRELSANTFYNEINAIKQERTAQGKSEYGSANNSNTQAKSSFTPRYKAGQSDKEICIRNYGSVWACQDAEYSKNVANIMKKGGCIVSVPDVGLMYKDLSYCQSTNNTVNVLYLPTGETKLLNPIDKYNVAARPPMTDEEYRAELEEYNRTK